MIMPRQRSSECRQDGSTTHRRGIIRQSALPRGTGAEKGDSASQKLPVYKTRKGAQMGDLFMSLIHTSELNDVNAFDYLTELLRHPEELKQNPEWMPWNYRDTLARLAAAA